MTARKSKVKAAEPTMTADGKPLHTAFAEAMVGVSVRHGQLASRLGDALSAGTAEPDKPTVNDYIDAVGDKVRGAAKGDVAFASRLLAAQALSLDAIFTEMARRMALNMGEYLGATETYARIALKAQAGSRAALSELVKLHQPREQTVRHVHVNEGGQAVIADEFHHHGGGAGNGISDGQPHATGTGAAGASAALPGPDPLGQGVPIPGGEGQPAMQDARRQGKRRA